MSDPIFDMSAEEKKQLSMEFIAEAVGHLEILNEKLLKAEESLKAGEEISKDDLDAMFRSAHTIKGTASFIGLRQIVSLTHDMETLLSAVKNGAIKLNAEIGDVLFSAMDKLEALCSTLKETGSDDGDITECLASMSGIIEKYTGVAPVVKQAAVPINKKYLDMFMFDAEQNIANFEKYLLAFEQNPDREDVLNGLFRIAHTLKGSAGLVSVVPILRLAHSMENILSGLQKKSFKCGQDTISMLFESLDVLKNLVSVLRNDGHLSGEIPAVCEKLDAYSKNTIEMPQSSSNLAKLSVEQNELVKQALADEWDIFRISVQLEEGMSFKSVKVALLEERLKKHGIVLFVSPATESISDHLMKLLEVDISFCSAINEKEIKSLLVTEGVVVNSIERLDREDAREVCGFNAVEPVKEKAAMPQIQQAQIASMSHGIEISTIKIDSHKLDALMNLSGELVIARARFTQSVRNFKGEIYARGLKDEAMTGFVRVFDELAGALGKISSGIQGGVMQTRMVPIEGVFARFKRVSRDLSKELNKEVNFVVEGEETELDKKIIDSLGDPLTHMVRNAIDHGLEDKNTRLSLGKTAVGTLCLKAYHKGNSICIEISDDGRGIDPEKIAAVALEKGLKSKEELDAMSREDKLNLIFIPGFSTAQKVTDLSGRGVGMDVVKNMIGSINGFVDIDTTIGQGTKFTLKLPLTLAIIQALLVISGGEIYALPIDSVTEIINIKNENIYQVDGTDTIKLRNHVLSLISFDEAIKINCQDGHKALSKIVVVVTDGQKRVGIRVDSLVGKEEIVIKSLSEYFSGVKGIVGASILGDGRIALILDAIGIIQEA